MLMREAFLEIMNRLKTVFQCSILSFKPLADSFIQAFHSIFWGILPEKQLFASLPSIILAVNHHLSMHISILQLISNVF